MSDIKSLLGYRIREIRKANNMTQEQLVEKIGSDTNNLSKIENGKKFLSAEKLVKIANALNVKVMDLFNFEHIAPDNELIAKINNEIKNFDSKQLKYLLKTIQIMKEYDP